jgi:hypothetical protein
VAGTEILGNAQQLLTGRAACNHRLVEGRVDLTRQLGSPRFQCNK